MIDIGVASPRAHGHAMMRTATALTMAKAKRGSGPNHAQTANVIAATASTAGNKIAGNSVGQRLNRRAASLRFRDHVHDLREQRCRCRRARRA